MRQENISEKEAFVVSHHEREEKYWLDMLSGIPEKSYFPYDYSKSGNHENNTDSVPFSLPGKISSRLLELSRGHNHRLHMSLVSGLVVLLGKYTGNLDITVGIPIYKQDIQGEFINTMLAIRNHMQEGTTFKELLLQMNKSIYEAVEHQNYPIESLVRKLDMTCDKIDFPLFDVVILLENIHDKKYIPPLGLNMVFSFVKRDESIDAVLEYNSSLYSKKTIEQVIHHFMLLLEKSIFSINQHLTQTDFLTDQEKQRLLIDLNDTKKEFPIDKTIHELLQQQVDLKADNVAVVHEDQQVTYKKLNQEANRLAALLIKKGVGPDSIVGLLMERSVQMIIGIFGILKAGGAYLPIEQDYPENRIISMLDDCRASILLTEAGFVDKHSWSKLQGLNTIRVEPRYTGIRPQYKNFDSLPYPDRSLVNYESYNRYIGQALVKNCISLQATRGCPYKCTYCHKIWPKTHVFRSAENIFEEVMIYYNMGVRRFAFIDDIFNLKRENSMRFFQKVIKHKMDIQLFFPNGMRGDLLTAEYIDLMVEAGTVNLALALETASPRLQKLMEKYLNLEKLKENLQYICKKHPHVTVDLFTMHGFPTETEEEALMTLDFIKNLKWLHFPYIFILKIFPGTEMADLAMKHGISRGVIERSANMAYHEASDTLVFDREFTMKYQTDFLNDYFLSKERLLHVLPNQLKILTNDEITQKYSAYLGSEITSLDALLKVVGISREELGVEDVLAEDYMYAPNLNEKLKKHFYVADHEPDPDAVKILILELSTYFSHHVDVFYNTIEPPLGPMYLKSYLKQEYGSRINFKMLKSRIDYDSYEDLRAMLEEFKPDVIGVRTLTLMADFFHKGISLVRQWGFDVPIIAGGPYATSAYRSILQDKNIDIVVVGEGEVTFSELIAKIMENGGKLPDEEVLNEIKGIAFNPQRVNPTTDKRFAREIIIKDLIKETLEGQPVSDPQHIRQPDNLAYVIYTSGSTGNPKGTLTTHSNVNRVVKGTNYIAINEEDTLLQLSNYAFDGSVFDIFGALLNGGKLVLMKDLDVPSIESIAETIRKQAVNVFFVTTALFNTLVDVDLACLENIRKVLFGGERVSVEHTKKALDYLGENKIIHMYGPTETTVYATYYHIDEIDDRWGTIPIGRPLANTVTYILDKNMQLVPLSVSGELYIGGEGVSRGYLNNPELTARKFVPNPFVEGDYLYKTGDLARWLQDGHIEFISRVDQQVKIRGYRIEPGELEHHLLKIDSIREAVVVARESKKGDKQLCAYYVPTNGGNMDVLELRSILAGEVPDFMIPTHFVELDQLPLTPNKKVDIKALPDPKAGISGADYTVPRNEMEETFTGIWSDVLGIDKKSIGIDSNFFDLGGHSLNCTILVSRLHKEFNVKVPLAEIFRTPTIRELSGYVEASVKDRHVSIEPAPEQEYYALSSAQKRLFVLQQLENSLTVYNIPAVVILEGDLDKVRFEEIIHQLVQRHEGLRTSFHVIADEPVQKVQKEVDFKIEHFEGEEDDLENLVSGFIQVFHLSKAPLMRAGIIKVAEKEHILILDMHHIITDGTSMGLFIKEFMVLYEGGPLDELRIQYKDFAHWCNRRAGLEEMEKQEKYWLKQFDGQIPVLNLPTDYPRPVVQSFKGNHMKFEMSPEDTCTLKTMASEIDLTLYMAVLAVFNIVLAKLSGNEDIAIGSPIAARRHADLQQIIGMFVNTLAMRNYPAGTKSVIDFMMEVKTNTLEAFENQDYPFENLVEKVVLNRNTGRNPVFDVVFALQNIDIPDIELPGLKSSQYDYDYGIAKFDLTLNVTEAGDKLIFFFEYCSDLFKAETIEKYMNYFKKTVSAVLHGPEVRIADLEIISAEEKNRVLFDFNNTQNTYPRDKTIHELFQKQVESTPDNTALVFEDHVLTYRKLNEKADALASYLHSLGVKAEEPVALLAENSHQVIVALLGILKAGAAYLPLNVEYPDERKKYILRDCFAKLILTNCKNVYDYGSTVVDLDDSRIYENPYAKDFPGEQNSKNMAYIMYTSGSTGTPKGVMVEHGSVVRLVKNTDFVTFEEGDAILLTGALEFDASTFEIWAALLNGLTLHLARKDTILSHDKLKQLVGRRRVTTMWMTSPFFNRMLDADIEIFKGLKNLLVGGDVLSPAHTNRVRNRFPALNVINGYGPTENTTFSTTFLVDKDYQKSIPIGKPIRNSFAYILDRNNHPVPIGVAGELFVGGDGLSRGYLNNPELTAEKFIENPYPSIYNTRLPMIDDRLYRTGDRVSWFANGIIEFLGRMDHQVKIRGYRIEPGEIENHLLNHDKIKEAVVVQKSKLTNDGEDEDKYLAAYIVADKEFNSAELRDYLAQQLPEYMIPSFFLRIDQIPLTSTGKINRLALPEPQGAGIGREGEEYIGPRDELEAKLTSIWSEVLAIKENLIGINDNFFQLGGHSLKATFLTAKIHKELDAKISLADVFTLPTIKGLAVLMKRSAEDRFRSIEKAEEKEFYTQSSAQKRMFVLHQMEENTAGYNIPSAIILEGAIDNHQLEQAFKQLIARHESLRTSFETIAGEPIQKIHKSVDFEIEYFDFPVDEEVREQITADFVSSFVRPFNLNRAPLLRVGMLPLDLEKHLMVVDIHHIIADGMSMGILINEFPALYSNRELAPLKFQYKDYSQWRNSKQEQKSVKLQESFWLKEFCGELPLIDLPIDYPRPRVQRFDGNDVGFELSEEETKKFKQLASEKGVTFFMLFLALYNIFLSKICRQEDIVVGTPKAGRRHSDLEHIIGMFVNTLCLRNHPHGEKTFGNFLKEVKKKSLEAFDNQDYQYENLVDHLSVKRDTGRNPIFDVSFSTQSAAVQQMEIPNLKLKLYEYENHVSKFDLSLHVFVEKNFFFNFTYSTSLFKRTTIKKFTGYFKKMLTEVLKDPDRKISEIEILPEQEKERLLMDFSGKEMEHPRDKNIHQLFEQQVERSPDKIAILWKERQLTYSQLNRQANQVKSVLLAKGVKSGSIVGLMVPPSNEMAAGLLGILKAGGAYLPIDPEYPRERVLFMLADSGASVLVSDNATVTKKEAGPEIVRLSECLEAHVPADVNAIDHRYRAYDLAYVIYTSGTTGKPKGVLVEHRSVVAYIYSLYEAINISARDSIIQQASFTFDHFVAELFPMLLKGGTVLMLEKNQVIDPYLLAEFIAKHFITIVASSPMLLNNLNGLDNLEAISSVHTFVNGGDVLKKEHIQGLLQKGKVYNTYGPTEATVIVTCSKCRETFGTTISIGKPTVNDKVYILDKYMKLVPIGIPGELFAGGAGVTRGYLNNPDLTHQKFPANPFEPGTRMYRTGDLVRWLPDGNIEFLGRIDHQVQIRGYRIELEEIENQLLNHPDIKEAVVSTDGLVGEDKQLCTYFVANANLTATQLKNYLSKQLPNYMIPPYFVQLDRIPMTSRGKVDRKALPRPKIMPDSEYTAPRDKIEEKLAQLWAEVLGIKKDAIGINDDFFNLGGHSIKATGLFSKIRKEFKVNIPLVVLFITPTIKSLSGYIKNAENESKTTKNSNLVLLKPGIDSTNHLFLIHDGTGEVEGYIELCMHLNDKFNYWGIRANRLKNSTPQNRTIEELAQIYIEKIKKLQSHGPYFIAGWSLGGTIAFEIGRQLEQMNDRIGFLALIDSPPPKKTLAKKLVKFNLRSELKYVKPYLNGIEIEEKLKHVTDLSQLWLLMEDYLETGHYDVEQIKKAISRYGMHELSNYRQLNIKESIYYLNLGRTFDNAKASYIPAGKIDAASLFFKAGKSKFNESSWATYFKKPLEFHGIDGNHFSILRIPGVFEFAPIFNQALIDSIKTLRNIKIEC